MNDCLWCFICSLCNGEECNGCPKYLSVNTEKGEEMLAKYQIEVNEALKPLTKKWKDKMNEYTAD